MTEEKKEEVKDLKRVLTLIDSINKQIKDINNMHNSPIMTTLQFKIMIIIGLLLVYLPFLIAYIFEQLYLLQDA